MTYSTDKSANIRKTENLRRKLFPDLKSAKNFASNKPKLFLRVSSPLKTIGSNEASPNDAKQNKGDPELFAIGNFCYFNKARRFEYFYEFEICREKIFVGI